MNDEGCELCGHLRDLTTRLVHWSVSLPGMAYEHITACRDREACRGRVQAQGKPWPVVETTAERRAS